MAVSQRNQARWARFRSAVQAHEAVSSTSGYSRAFAAASLEGLALDASVSFAAVSALESRACGPVSAARREWLRKLEGWMVALGGDPLTEGVEASSEIEGVLFEKVVPFLGADLWRAVLSLPFSEVEHLVSFPTTEDP